MITSFAKPTEEQVSLLCKDSCTVPTESRSEKSLYQVLDGLAGFSCELEKTCIVTDRNSAGAGALSSQLSRTASTV